MVFELALSGRTNIFGREDLHTLTRVPELYQFPKFCVRFLDLLTLHSSKSIEVLVLLFEPRVLLFESLYFFKKLLFLQFGSFAFR